MLLVGLLGILEQRSLLSESIPSPKFRYNPVSGSWGVANLSSYYVVVVCSAIRNGSRSSSTKWVR